MEAGRAAKAFSELGCQVSIAIPPDGTKDSNELLVKFGADAVCEMVAAAVPFVNGCDRDAKGDRGHAGDDDDAVPDNEFDAAIKKLAALSPAQYERVRKDKAKRCGVRVKILDKFVVAAKPPDESTPGQGRPIELPDVVPWDALIGRLPSTLDDRSLHVDIKRKTAAEKVAPFRLGRIPDLDELARKAARWAADNVEALRGSDPKMPLGVENRAADNWEPLFAIADLVGERWA